MGKVSGPSSRRALLGLATACFLPSLCRASELRRLEPPSDDEGSDPALRDLIQRMVEFVESRDHRRLRSLMSPDFRVEFDSGKGPQSFLRRWQPTHPDSALWQILQRALALRGTFYSKSLYSVPYVYTQFPMDLDPLTWVVATGADVPLWSQPSPQGERLATLDFAIAPLVDPLRPPVLLPKGGYLEVKHPDLGNCFVSSDAVYSPAGHRLFFEKRRGAWHWISFAAATLAEPPELRSTIVSGKRR